MEKAFSTQAKFPFLRKHSNIPSYATTVISSPDGNGPTISRAAAPAEEEEEEGAACLTDVSLWLADNSSLLASYHNCGRLGGFTS